MRLGVYGGSFDPPHYGHVRLVEHLLSERLVDRVLVVPVYFHAFHKKMESFEARLHMCHAAFSAIMGAEVSSIESQLPVPNYTLYTLEAIRKAWPQAHLRLVIGADVLDELDRWHRVEEVKRLAPPLVLGRAGVISNEAPVPILPDISSTQVRRCLADRETLPREELLQLVPEKVLTWIEQEQLYLEPSRN